MTTNWLDIIPAIPLARGVPLLVVYEDAAPEPAICLDAFYPHETRTRVRAPRIRVDIGSKITSVTWGDQFRVDLDDPQGFAYALRWLTANHPAALGFALGFANPGAWWLNAGHGWMVRALLKTTDADRLALARALAEVSR